MSRATRSSGSVTVPARVSVSDFAEAIGRPMSEVQAVLESREEPSAPGDFIGPGQSDAVGKVMGFGITVEPRDLALETLYEMEVRDETEVPRLPGRAEALVKGVLTRRESLDHAIEAASEHWSVARMPVIDRAILRLGLYELKHEPDTPTAVVVSEAVRLAKTYSTERSGSFVNGVLASLARSERG